MVSRGRNRKGRSWELLLCRDLCRTAVCEQGAIPQEVMWLRSNDGRTQTLRLEGGALREVSGQKPGGRSEAGQRCAPGALSGGVVCGHAPCVGVWGGSWRLGAGAVGGGPAGGACSGPEEEGDSGEDRLVRVQGQHGGRMRLEWASFAGAEPWARERVASSTS